jgi:hypothetical protein
VNVSDSAYTAGTTGVTLALALEAAPATPAVDAVTVNVYAVPLLKPVIVKGELAPDAVNPPGELVAVYETVPLPVYAGAVKVTVACPLPAVAFTLVGVPGTRPD